MRFKGSRSWASSPAAVAARFSWTACGNTISKLKCNSDQWLEVMRIAHRNGLNSSATMMFGHVETVAERIESLRRLRELQDETGGFTAFICWTFQPENTRLKATPVGSHLKVSSTCRRSAASSSTNFGERAVFLGDGRDRRSAR